MKQYIHALLISTGLLLSLQSLAEPVANAALSDPLDRNELIRAVLDANAGIDALQAIETAAIARIEPAGALDDPMLSYRLAPRQLGGGGQLDRSFSLEISQKLPWPGKLADRAAAARAQSRVAAADIDILRLKLRELTAAAYAEWAFVEQALNINHEHQTLLEELRTTAESQYAAGRGARQNILQADTERGLLQKQALELRRQRDGLRARINGLLNREANRPLPAPTTLAAPRQPEPFEVLARLARDTHPELVKIEHRIGGRAARVDLAAKEFYPDFRISGGYNSMMPGVKHRPMIGVAINVPFDQSRRRAELSAAKAELKESEWRLIDARHELLAQLESARAAVAEAAQSFELYQQELVPLARETLDAALTDYSAGRSDFLNIISAERNQLTTELGQARTRADYHRRLAELERTVGQPLNQGLSSSSGLKPIAGIRVVLPRENDLNRASAGFAVSGGKHEQ